jgi:hypothetical protein
VPPAPDPLGGLLGGLLGQSSQGDPSVLDRVLGPVERLLPGG